MNKLHSTGVIRQSGPSLTPRPEDGLCPEQLEVNVVFTELTATAAALRAAGSLAQGLEACIRLRAGIAVPRQLPLDRPQVSADFFREQLCSLVAQPELDGSHISVHLYICRDWMQTVCQVLKPNSVVILGGREGWRPTATSRLAKTLRAKGHRVTLVDVKRESAVKVAG